MKITNGEKTINIDNILKAEKGKSKSPDDVVVSYTIAIIYPVKFDFGLYEEVLSFDKEQDRDEFFKKYFMKNATIENWK